MNQSLFKFNIPNIYSFEIKLESYSINQVLFFNEYDDFFLLSSDYDSLSDFYTSILNYLNGKIYLNNIDSHLFLNVLEQATIFCLNLKGSHVNDFLNFNADAIITFGKQ